MCREGQSRHTDRETAASANGPQRGQRTAAGATRCGPPATKELTERAAALDLAGCVARLAAGRAVQRIPTKGRNGKAAHQPKYNRAGTGGRGGSGAPQVGNILKGWQSAN